VAEGGDLRSCQSGGNDGTGYNSDLVDIQLNDIGDLRFRRQVERFHQLGPRCLFEFLTALGADRLIRTDLELRVKRYLSRLDPVALSALGADRLAAPIHVVRLDGGESS